MFLQDHAVCGTYNSLTHGHNGLRSRRRCCLALNTTPCSRIKQPLCFLFGRNFGRWTSIITILSLWDSAANFIYFYDKDFYLTLAVLLHYLAKFENPIYLCSKNNPFLFSYFFHSVFSVTAEQSRSEPRRLCGVGDFTRTCVQAPQDHGRGRASPACRGGMWPSGPGSDWQRAQWMAQVTDSLRCSRRRIFWTLTLNITAFVHTLINMFWTLLTLLRVKQINFFLCE